MRERKGDRVGEEKQKKTTTNNRIESEWIFRYYQPMAGWLLSFKSQAIQLATVVRRSSYILIGLIWPFVRKADRMNDKGHVRYETSIS